MLKHFHNLTKVLRNEDYQNREDPLPNAKTLKNSRYEHMLSVKNFTTQPWFL